MKKNQKLFLTGLFLYLIPQSSTAQWQFPFPNAYGRLNLIQPNEVIGVGRFPTLNDVRARLHVNSFYLSLSSATTPVTFGEVFRTDATNAVDNTWQMWSGLTAATTTEKFRLFNPAGLNDIALQSSAGSMNFNTVGGIHRMIINGVTGNIGIGTNFTLPMNLVHQDVQHVIGVPTVNYHQFTNTQTGALTTDGFQIGINHLADPLNPGNFYSRAELRHLEDAPIHFFTNNQQRMVITHATLNFTERGRALVQRFPGAIIFPRSMMHLGDNYLNPNPGSIGGWRHWMEIGTFNTMGTDFAWFGLMQRLGDTTIINGDQNDAVLAWGDNVNNQDGGDNLRFIFSSPLGVGGGNSAGWNASEKARITAMGRFGIGNFSLNAAGGGSGVQPARRLEIYDEHLDPFINAHAPQLRLTFTPDAIGVNGVWTDFETMASGDLQINNSNNNVPQSVGINNGTNPLTRTLDVNGNLRLRTLPNAGFNANGSTLINRFMVANANGEVFWRDDIGNGTGDVTACTSPGAALNYLTKWNDVTLKQVCPSIIFDNGTNVGVGIGNNPLFRLHVNGDIALGNTNGHIFKYDGNSSNYRRIFTCDGPSLSNVSIGPFAGPAGLSMLQCVFAGFRAAENMAGNYNTVLGSEAGANISGSGSNQNTFIGWNAASNLTSGSYNVIAGALGVTPPNNYSGNYNSIFGYRAGSALSSIESNANVLIGSLSGVGLEAGSNNVFIGNSAQALSTTLNNAGAIGAYAQVVCSDCIALGSATQRVGIGSANPNSNFRLEVNGSNGGGTSSAARFASATESNYTAEFWNTGTYGTSWVAFFNGPTVSTATQTTISDSLVKNDILCYTNACTVLDSINVYSYTFDTVNYSSLNFDSGAQLGFLAQEVEKFLPDAVKTVPIPETKDSAGNVIIAAYTLKGIQMDKFIPYLFYALKEQKSEINELKDNVNSCCNLRTTDPGSTQQGSIELENIRSIQLDQNDPNPFSANTIIRWNISADFGTASIYFFDNTGNRINSFEINSTGAGELQVFGSKLSAGVYTYSLVVDGKVIESKKMLRTK